MAVFASAPVFKNRIVRWIDYRLPIFTFMHHQLDEYPTPRNLSYWWNFGSLAGITLVIMILTGITLAMHYTPEANSALAAFFGYTLPWGQMSFWGATVITNLLSAVPVIGTSLVQWLQGGFSIGDATLHRFYALHYLLPFVIVGLVFVHLWALHRFGSNNPLGIDVKDSPGHASVSSLLHDEGS